MHDDALSDHCMPPDTFRGRSVTVYLCHGMYFVPLVVFLTCAASRILLSETVDRKEATPFSSFTKSESRLPTKEDRAIQHQR